MNISIQLLSILFSFIFGILFRIVLRFHLDNTKYYPFCLQIITSVIFIVDITLLYLLLIYYINYGIIHIYFIIMIFLGFYFEKYVKLLSFKVNDIVKHFIKWYNSSEM